MNILEEYLRQGHVALYDYKGQQLPDLMCDKKTGTVSLFFKERKNHAFTSNEFDVQNYRTLSNIRSTNNHRIDVSILDGEAVKLLMAKMPYNGPYLLVPMSLRAAWLVGLPGLLRRLVFGSVKLRGTVTLKTGEKSQKWLILQYMHYTYGGGSISVEVGIQGLLDFLRDEEVKYAVLKSWEKLPELFRPHGDLDILVADEHFDKVWKFLLANPGPTKIDLVPSTSEWWPPPVTARILETSVPGPAGSRVPAPKDAFLANAYNAVYIKGFAAGIPSRMPGAVISQDPKNDYGAIVAKMAKDLDIDVPIELESLEEYLHQEGWRPQAGCFANLAGRNEWLRRMFWTEDQSKEVGLGLLILKEKALRLGVVDRIIEEIENQQYMVLRKKTFDTAEKQIAMTLLRGGNWRTLTGEATYDYEPAMAVAILDTRPYSVFYAKQGVGESRVRQLKLGLRKIFDDDPSSLVHSTDLPGDTWEYIEQCFPEDVKDIREELREYFRNFKSTLGRKFRFSLQRHMTPRKLRRIPHRILIRLFVN